MWSATKIQGFISSVSLSRLEIKILLKELSTVTGQSTEDSMRGFTITWFPVGICRGERWHLSISNGGQSEV